MHLAEVVQMALREGGRPVSREYPERQVPELTGQT
jgi:hypothetical protein